MSYIICKVGIRYRDGSGYRGNFCKKAGIVPGKIYYSFKEAEIDCLKLADTTEEHFDILGYRSGKCLYALLAKPVNRGSYRHWIAWAFNTQVQSYVENFMSDIAHNRYFLVNEKDFEVSTEYPYHYYHTNSLGRFMVWEEDVQVCVLRKGINIIGLNFMMAHLG